MDPRLRGDKGEAMRLSPVLMILALTLTGGARAQQPMPAMPLETTGVGRDQTAATKVAENIYQAIGFGNTFLVTTPAGNVIIDTSIAFNAPLHTKLLRAVSSAPIKYIVLTHAHGDHTGGIAAWRKFGAPDLKIIAQREHVDFQHYQTRLKGFFDLRNAAQFGRPPPCSGGGESPGNYAAKIEPTIVFDDQYEFELGGVQFKVLSTPGETYDHPTVGCRSQGGVRRRQLLRVLPQHVHAARHAAALGARLRQFAQQGACAQAGGRPAESRRGDSGATPRSSDG